MQTDCEINYYEIKYVVNWLHLLKGKLHCYKFNTVDTSYTN
jgi:hypothetical protein